MTQDDFQRMRDWVDGAIACGNAPAWTTFHYLKLREALDQILAGIIVARTQRPCPQWSSVSAATLRLVVSNDGPPAGGPVPGSDARAARSPGSAGPSD